MSDIQVKGLPKSGTTALTDYLREYTGLNPKAKDKHQPRQPTRLPVVHIMKHPCAWITSYADWCHSAASREDLERWMWVKMKLYDWAALARAFHDQARVTVTHHDLITDLHGTLTRVCEAVQAPHKAPEHNRIVELTTRRKGSPTGKGPFDPQPYLDREYLDAYPAGVLDNLWSELCSGWGEQVQVDLGAPGSWWTVMATPKPKNPPTQA